MASTSYISPSKDELKKNLLADYIHNLDESSAINTDEIKYNAP